ncbi:MAG TPA: DUF4857 domain-containing protein [Caldithrix abyssi]|uniref:DUF4857 domain-containing protein n=1 Tax=Caldithrix abyssi TaxID=187145 RepID=A0A7V5PRI4_CALAY|nr:DUF4857 domain-containing protein [Caldithrix abyssi]
MMTRVSRIFLIILTIFVGAIYLPKYYWVAFEKRIAAPIVYYSPVIERFVIGHFTTNGYYYSDETGKRYTHNEMDRILPLLNYRILAARGRMPDSLLHVKIDVNQVRKNNLILNIRPKDIFYPEIPLFPLFESKPPRLRLKLPQEFFRITHRMEFIDSRTNQIDREMSEKYTRALKEVGFHFPAQSIFGNPTTRKPFDVGYFVVDADGEFFHIRRIRNIPRCDRVTLPEGIRVKWMGVYEKELKEFYGVVISEDNQVFLLMFNQYYFQKLPISDYDPKTCSLRLMGTLFYRWVSVTSNGYQKTYLMDRNYRLLKTYEESWKEKYQTTAGVVSKYLFPFEISLQDKTKYVTIHFTDYRFRSLIFNGILALIVFILIIRGRKLRFRAWVDIFLVLVTGLFGFIGVLLLEHPLD